MSLMREISRIREPVTDACTSCEYDELVKQIVELTARLNLTSKSKYELFVKYDDLKAQLKG